MTARTAGAVLFGAFVGAWIGRAAFKWILDLPGDWPLVLSGVSAAIGALVCFAGDRETTRAKTADE